jgi:hypothetical protein
MAPGTGRPFGVSFAAGWAAIGGAFSLLKAFGMSMTGAAVAGTSDSVTVLAIGFAALYLLIGFGLLVVAGGLYKVQSWARTVGMVLFGLFALLNLYSVVDGSALTVIDLTLNATALAFLAVNGAAFASGRPNVSDRSPHQVGRN